MGFYHKETELTNRCARLSGLINALTNMLVVSHDAPRAEGARAEAKRRGEACLARTGVHKAWNGTPLTLRA